MTSGRCSNGARRLSERLALERLRIQYSERKEKRTVNTVTIRIIFASAFGLTSLVGALILELMGSPCPPWLVALVGAASGYVFGFVQANGITGKH